ncbi:MAG: hypothetical protein NW226_13035 [Microscillaceae bacterium]|nr:hypothetical protein [Microscillaceae bacterium]
MKISIYSQAAELPEGEDFAFGTNVCAPYFEFHEFRLGLRDELIAIFPQHEVHIRRRLRVKSYVYRLR